MTALNEPDPLETAETVSSPGIMNLLQIAWQRRSLVMLGVVGGLIIGGIAFMQKPATYQTNAQLIVIKKQGNPLSGTEPDPRQSYYDDYVATHQVLIKSPIVVAKAVQNLAALGDGSMKQYSSLRDVSDPIQAIRSALTVQREGKDPLAASNVLNLSYRGTNANDCEIIVDAVIDSYKDFLDKKYKNVSNTVLVEINRAVVDMQKSFDIKKKTFAGFSSQGPAAFGQGN
jgi:uncharacterized protein involved in exopolysaccharide biosynthesis